MTSSSSRTALTFTAVVAALALGCQAPDEADDHELLAQDGVSCDPSIDGGVVEPAADAAVDVEVDAGAPDAGPPSPERPYFAEVTANGTGCPAGTWEASISPDGEDFVVTTSAFEAIVEGDQRIAFKDCNLTVKLRSPSNLSYAVSDFAYQGYAFLEHGVKGFQTANYYFQGNPVPATDKEKRTDLTGPVDRSYLFQDTVTTADAVWSPCGLDRNLQIVTRLGLQKAEPGKGSGYIKLQELRGPKLMWKKC